MRLSRLNGIRVYGLLWLGAGLMLMSKGMPLLVKSAIREELPLISFLKPFTGSSEQAAMVLVLFSLVLGLLKGRLVLAKAANKMMARLSAFSDPVSIGQLFTLRYCLILSVMILLGISLRFFHLPFDIHGMIDLAVGSALINGALVYFRGKSFVVGGAAPNL
jgi:hypothetical protein